MKRAKPFVNVVHIANSVATHGGTDVTRGAQSGKQPTRRILRDDTWLRLVATMNCPRKGAHFMPRWQAQPATIFHAIHEFG